MSSRSAWQIWRLTRPSAVGRFLRSPHSNADHGRLYQRRSARVGTPWLSQASFTTAIARHNSPDTSDTGSASTSKEVQERMQELNSATSNLYPRYRRSPSAQSIRELLNEGSTDTGGDRGSLDPEEVEVSGRITAIRSSGSKLTFIDIVEDQLKLQLSLSYASLEASGITLDEFKHHCRLIRRGDYISIKGGRPFKARGGQISIKASGLPVLLAPCLQRFPVEQRGFATSEFAEANYHARNVEMLTDPEVVETLKARSTLVRTLRTFFEERSFVEVGTPILSALAGGATAKPFETTATEFTKRKLSLRIAPELWLKRLIIGGMDKVFEIGPCFRNEGLDKTHNPEFTTCEFYAVGHDLPQLMNLTKLLLTDIAKAMQGGPSPRTEETTRLLESVQAPYQELDFIPFLNAALGLDLPNLATPAAQRHLLEIFESKHLPLPSNPTVPRLVDKLASIYIEPHSRSQPTWITNIPECLSPLAKSSTHPTARNEQPVGARAELFIRGKEVVNCYEEENSPFEQRRKFLDQQRYARPTIAAQEDVPGSSATHQLVDEEAMKVDEEYLGALEWGLPPTGGWGCGIDRLVMLFTGKERIGDVLSFGNLRAVTRGAERRSS